MTGRWVRCVPGYEWREGQNLDDEDDRGPWLAEKGRILQPYAVLRFRQQVLRNLVSLGNDPSPEKIVDFANRWGSLGEQECPIRLSDGTQMSLNSLTTWRVEATRIARLFAL